MGQGVCSMLKVLILAGICLIVIGNVPVSASDKPFQHLVVLGDPHIPGEHIESKKEALETIKTWTDVDMIISVGDICEDRGTDDEYAAAKEFFSKLKKPFYPIVGNHDYIYADNLDSKGKRVKAVSETRERKLRKFRETFNLQDISYTVDAGKYFLVFLSLDSPEHLAEISQKQIEWLRTALNKNRKTPTIIFFHAPLEGTLRSYNKNANTSNYVAQPSSMLHDILTDNPQVFLWVSGHTHTSSKEESFASAINMYEKRITNIHNTDMNRETIWTNSLLLYPDKVVVKTYNHRKDRWVPELERTIIPPKHQEPTRVDAPDQKAVR